MKLSAEFLSKPDDYYSNAVGLIPLKYAYCLGRLEPKASKSVEIEFLPILEGFQSIREIELLENLSDKTVRFKKIMDVDVCECE